MVGLDSVPYEAVGEEGPGALHALCTALALTLFCTQNVYDTTVCTTLG